MYYTEDTASQVDEVEITQGSAVDSYCQPALLRTQSTNEFGAELVTHAENFVSKLRLFFT